MKIDVSKMQGFEGTTVGMPKGEQREYPTIGYNATDGIFYIDENQANEIEIIPLAMRQRKEITDKAGIVYQYPIKTPKARMKTGDFSQRLQILCIVDGELHVFGARSWTAVASFVNNRADAPGHDSRFEVGIWYRLMDYIKNLRNNGTPTSPLCYSIKLTAGNPIDVSSSANPKQKSRSCPIVVESISFVGAELATEYAALYEKEDVDGWVEEWGKVVVNDPVEDDSANSDEDDEFTTVNGIPF